MSHLRALPTASAGAAGFALSGQHRDDLVSANGFAAYFLKPVDMDQIVAALAALLRTTH
jgi:DNA-binding response OmpR family regulator